MKTRQLAELRAQLDAQNSHFGISRNAYLLVRRSQIGLRKFPQRPIQRPTLATSRPSLFIYSTTNSVRRPESESQWRPGSENSQVAPGTHARPWAESP